MGSSNTTLDVGLGQGWEVGFNALDLNFYEKNKAPSFGQQQVNPDVIFNAQKGFELIDEVWSLGIGSQMGFNPAGRKRDIRYQNFTWVINELTLPDDKAKSTRVVTTRISHTQGRGSDSGSWAGTEIPIVKDKFHFQADVITGTRDISVAVIGASSSCRRNGKFRSVRKSRYPAAAIPMVRSSKSPSQDTHSSIATANKWQCGIISKPEPDHFHPPHF